MKILYRQHFRKNQGFSLIELMIAMAVTIIVLANLINRLAYSTRVTNAVLLQVAHELEESAWLSGAGTATTMARIVAPLVSPALLYAGLWTAMLR